MSDSKPREIRDTGNAPRRPCPADTFVVGYSRAANDAVAETVPFIVERRDLEALATYWAKQALTAEFFSFLHEVEDSRWETHCRIRLKEVTGVIGMDAVKSARQQAEDEFRRECDAEAWEIFKNGTKAEWETFRARVRQEVRNCVQELQAQRASSTSCQAVSDGHLGQPD